MGSKTWFRAEVHSTAVAQQPLDQQQSERVQRQRASSVWFAMSAFYAAIAICGSSILCFSSLPQIYHMHKRKSSEDISFYYQGLLSAGTFMSLVYYGFFSLWAIFFPLLFSFIQMLYLIGLKVRLGSFAPRGLRGVDEGTDYLGPSGSPRPAKRGSAKGVSTGKDDDGVSTESTPLIRSW